MSHKYTVMGALSPREEGELLSSMDRGIVSLTYNSETRRLVEFEVDSFTAWRIELAKALEKQ